MNGLTFLAPAQYATDFYPFADGRDAQDLLWGGRTLGEQWAGQIPFPVAINPLWIPSRTAFDFVAALLPGEGWNHGGTLLAQRPGTGAPLPPQQLPTPPDLIVHPTDLFTRCGEAILADWEQTADAWGAHPAPFLPDHVITIGPPNRLRIAEGCRALACTFNVETGPIVLGPGVEVQEGAHLRGPLVLGAGTVVKMGSRISGPTATGAECRLGGEISNSVLHAYTNKGHDGFLGNSVLGSWCNLGADTNTSNLKSNYSPVRIWHAGRQAFEETGLQFCGVLMGDHAKSSINTMFNTATTVGMASQIFGAGFPPKHIPPFSWGGASGFERYEYERFLRTAEAVMARRDQRPSAADHRRWRAAYDTAHA